MQDKRLREKFSKNETAMDGVPKLYCAFDGLQNILITEKIS